MHDAQGHRHSQGHVERHQHGQEHLHVPPARCHATFRGSVTYDDQGGQVQDRGEGAECEPPPCCLVGVFEPEWRVGIPVDVPGVVEREGCTYETQDERAAYQCQ